MSETDGKIQKITNLLEKGGTMLANHHECGAPMFRYQGKTVCPVCDFQEKHEMKQEAKQTKIEQKYEKEGEVPGVIITREPRTDYHTVQGVVMNKILGIAASLEAETELSRVKEKMDCIEQGIRILKLLKD
jgi:UPF0148 protein